ncbi:MAG: phosphoglycerate dehydrogenase [Opitutales bacterium]
MTRVLLTTTSFQDTPGPHHEKAAAAGIEFVRERGPLSEARMLELAGEFDAFLCGDDAITRAVLEKSLPRLRIISKYGVGIDKIDVEAATKLGLPVTFCPGVNQTTVAEHVFALLLALTKNLLKNINVTRSGRWERSTGYEILGKRLGIVGLGRIGREVALRAKAFGLTCVAYDVYWPEAFAKEHAIAQAPSIEAIFDDCDIISLHTNLTEETRGLIDTRALSRMKDSVILINCARGELVEPAAMAEALKAGTVQGYAADVLDQEPPPADHPLLAAPNCIVTPHVGSRTYESVLRQAGMAVDNLILALKGEKPLAQVNDVPTKAL